MNKQNTSFHKEDTPYRCKTLVNNLDQTSFKLATKTMVFISRWHIASLVIGMCLMASGAEIIAQQTALQCVSAKVPLRITYVSSVLPVGSISQMQYAVQKPITFRQLGKRGVLVVKRRKYFDLC